MELKSDIKRYIIFSSLIFSLVTIFLVATKIELISIGYLYNLFLWIIDKQRSNSLIIDNEKIEIRSRLKIINTFRSFSFADIAEAKILDLRKRRGQYQSLELILKNGIVEKILINDIKKEKLEAFLMELSKHNIISSYDDWNLRKYY